MSQSSPVPSLERWPARVIARREGPLVHLTLDLPPHVLATYTMPGQYVSIVTAGTEGENGYFVLANPVGAGAWSLLVRGGGTVADALLAAPVGATFPTSAALGDGFPCDAARGRTLVLLCAGTGIAAAPPVLARRIAEGDGARTHALLGVRVVTELPCPVEVEAWRAAGARVTICVTREEPRGPGVARGYVQDVARDVVPDTTGAMLFAVGPDDMIQGARALARSLGMPESDVRTNY